MRKAGIWYVHLQLRLGGLMARLKGYQIKRCDRSIESEAIGLQMEVDVAHLMKGRKLRARGQWQEQ